MLCKALAQKPLPRRTTVTQASFPVRSFNSSTSAARPSGVGRPAPFLMMWTDVYFSLKERLVLARLPTAAAVPLWDHTPMTKFFQTPKDHAPGSVSMTFQVAPCAAPAAAEWDGIVEPGYQRRPVTSPVRCFIVEGRCTVGRLCAG